MFRSVSITSVLYLWLGEGWGFLTGELKEWVIVYIIDHVSRCLKRYPENMTEIIPQLSVGWVGMG